MIVIKILRTAWFFVLLIFFQVMSQRVHAVVTLNRGRGGPHKFGWANTNDRHATRRAFVAENACMRKLKGKLKVSEVYQKTENRYVHSY
jgi:hypothetical protein